MYVIQGIQLDCLIQVEFSREDKDEAVIEAENLLNSPTFEGDSVRIITRDGELVWDSKETQ